MVVLPEERLHCCRFCLFTAWLNKGTVFTGFARSFLETGIQHHRPYSLLEDDIPRDATIDLSGRQVLPAEEGIEIGRLLASVVGKRCRNRPCG